MRRHHFTGMTRILFAILAVLFLAGNALAVQNPLRDRLLRNDRSAEAVGWFQRADTGEFFQFDRSGPVAFLRARDDASSEILVLYSDRAPNGGTAFVTDMGREVVRLTSLGGVTYFPLDRPDGVIADFASPAGGIAPAPRSPEEVRARAESLAQNLSNMLDRNMAVEYAPAPRAGLGLQFDSLNTIEIAFAKVRDQRRRYRGLNRVQLATGQETAAYVQGDALVVIIVPQWGYAGRSSSDFIGEAILIGEVPS
jgi:hypothetical protein